MDLNVKTITLSQRTHPHTKKYWTVWQCHLQDLLQNLSGETTVNGSSFLAISELPLSQIFHLKVKLHFQEKISSGTTAHSML